MFVVKETLVLFLQAAGQDLVENEAILEAANQEALQLLEEVKNGDGLVDMNGFEAQLRLVNEKWNEAKVQVRMFVVKFILNISVLTFNILLCNVYLCWTWLHCSCWSLNISTFSNNLTINQFYLFLYIQHSCIHTSSLPTLPTILVETWKPFH